MHSPVAAGLLLATLVATTAEAQGNRATVIVTDSVGNRVAFAWVQLNAGIARAANDSGLIAFETDPLDSLRLTVRRMGYAPFDGKVARNPEANTYRVLLAVLPQALKRIAITSPQDNRLFRNGFYERMENAFKSSTPARFLGPEDLDSRNALRTSNILEGLGMFRLERRDGKVFVQGRGRCAVNFVLDGRRPMMMVEEALTIDGQTRITRRAQQDRIPVAVATSQFIRERSSIDELISPGSIAAMEVYQSANQGPVEFRTQAQESGCAMVVIWTGPRQ